MRFSGFSYDTRKLEGLLLSIAQLIEARGKLLQSLKSKVPDDATLFDRFLDRINTGSGLTEEVKQNIVQGELATLSPELQLFEESFGKQTELLQQV